MAAAPFQKRPPGLWAGLLALAFVPALAAIEPPVSPSLPALTQPAAVAPVLPSGPASIPDAPGRLTLELAGLDGTQPAETVRQVRADVDRYCRMGNGETARLWPLVWALRYLQDKQLLGRPQFDAPVRAQLDALTDEVRTALAGGKFGQVPLDEAELGKLCRQYPYAPIFTAIDPHFRVPVPPAQADEIRTKLRARLEDMGQHHLRMWMNVPELSREDRETLWRAFVRDTIDQLIVMPIVAAGNEAVAAYGTPEEKAALPAGASPAPATAEKTPPPESDETEFDLLRTSNERLFTVALALLPMVADTIATTNAGEWRSFLVRLHLKSALPPHTEISMHMSVGFCRRWWVIAFTDLESNDGRLLAEQNLGGKCFVYDADNWRLYEHSRQEGRLSLLLEGVGQRFDGSIYFLKDYRWGDLLNALNCVNSLSRAWSLPPAAPPELAFLPTVFGRPSASCFLQRADGQAAEIRMGGDRILLEGRKEEAGRSLTNAVLPGISCAFRLAPNRELGEQGGHVLVRRSLFAQGLTLRQLAVSPSETVTILNAPGRLDAMAGVQPTASPPVRRVPEPGEEEALLFAAQLVRSSSLLNLRLVLDQILAAATKDKPVMDHAADLYLLDSLATAAPVMPEELQFKLNDVKIGLLLAMDRQGDVLPLLTRQARLLQSNTDKEYVEDYRDFYAGKLAGRPKAPSAANGRLPCFLAEAAAQEKQLHDARQAESSRKPNFTISLQPPGKDGPVYEEDVAARLDTWVGEQHGPGETASYVKAQLELLWQKFPDFRQASRAAAGRIETLWKAGKFSRSKSTNDFLQANETAVLIWKTYHCLLTDHHPLASAESGRKKAQLQKLGEILEGLEEEVVRQNPRLPKGAYAAIRAEAQRCRARLDEYGASPDCPLFYYPLHDAAFERAVAAVEAQMQREVRRFVGEYAALRQEQLGEALRHARQAEGRVDFFQNRMQTWSALQGRAVVGLTMGNIVRHYGVVDRNLDFNDPVMFPLWKVNGLSVVYRLQEGLSVEQKIDWQVLVPSGQARRQL